MRAGALLLLSLAAPAAALETCPGCRLGIWDEPAMVHNFGFAAPQETKIFYVGLEAPPTFSFTNVEFSIAGIGPSNALYEFANSCNQGTRPFCTGSASSPADTSITSTGTGGMLTLWQECRTGTEPLIAIAVTFASDPAPQDVVLRIKRRYPSTDPEWHTPVAWNCAAPRTAFAVDAGCYVLNPSGRPVDCATVPSAVAERSWGFVKRLYRD